MLLSRIVIARPFQNYSFYIHHSTTLILEASLTRLQHTQPGSLGYLSSGKLSASTRPLSYKRPIRKMSDDEAEYVSFEGELFPFLSIHILSLEELPLRPKARCP